MDVSADGVGLPAPWRNDGCDGRTAQSSPPHCPAPPTATSLTHPGVAGTQSTVEWTWPADGNHTQLAIRLARVNTSADVSSNFYAVVNSSDLKATQGITPL